MAQRKKLKICLVGECLSDGGAEKVQAVLSDYFINKGIDVCHVVFISRIQYTFSGRLMNLGEIEHSSRLIRKFLQFMAFRSFIKDNNFTVIIDSRTKHNFFQEFLINMFIYSRKTYFLIHSANLELYFPKKNRWRNWMYHKGNRVVGVSHGISDKISQTFKWEQIRTMYNPINIQLIQSYAKGNNKLDFDYVLAVGRMNSSVKQFDKLIKTYASSQLIKQGFRLVILGTGSLKKELKELTKQLQIEDFVLFEGFQSNPYSYMKKAKYLILCSEYEGFGNVLVESLAAGTPVVSFDCEAGPREIIQHQVNGLLVKNQDFTAMQEAMHRMIFDKDLYQTCQSNAQLSVSKFDIEYIGKQWLDLLKIKSLK